MANDTYYDFYDLPSDEVKASTKALAQFVSIIGGSKTISMVSYTSVFPNGGSMERYFPGQISFAPITLYRHLDDKCVPLMKWFEDTAAGKIEKKNCSIAQIELVENEGVHLLTIWDLINTLPIAQPGFSYNSYRGTTSTKYKLTLQAEEIIITYVAP